MKDTQLYERLLGLEKPWIVEQVNVDVPTLTITVTVSCGTQVWGCPVCGQRAHVHGSERRRWRHLDSCQFKTYVEADVPRVKCEEHGTATVKVPWAEARSRFSLLFESLAIRVLQACSMAEAARLLGITWAEADGIKQRAVARGLARKKPANMPRLCVDENSFGRGHDYVTVVSRPAEDGKTVVEDLRDGCTEESLGQFWASCTPDQRAAVRAVAMDLWQPYIQSTAVAVPAAEIVHDPFHLMRHMNVAVNEVRKAEHRALSQRGDTRLKGTRQLWLYGLENLPERWRERLDALRIRTLKTARAWGLKEMLRDLWVSASVAEGQAFFDAWYASAVRCRMKPVVRVARMLKAHLPRILTYFRHRLSNAFAESINNKIQGLVKKAFGYRSRERFKTDILFHFGGLNLLPGTLNQKSHAIP